ncbi:hypothetical protein J2Z76_002592 [Sedimentibacter acidaminivorans]|uniref:SLH domain-containing protein n=1 Tax=Sedimentibacter acidaminivorans TaxID=913099 RepID=A0ABS4GG98_9FIRM|nr:S-layer homology domain-containing protein [Sedimentibacter acidaminivorans]MBP1926722.1 hypothetical protein [Sedimentibacter acidaminivorans]
MKKIITTIAIIIIIFSSSASAAEINFTDVKTDDWFYKNLQELTEKNIISGYQDSTFKPGNTLKFEEFIKMLVVAVEEKLVSQKGKHEWYQIYIDKAIECKYITEQQKSLIDQNIDRQTMAEILYNVLTEKEEITAYTDAELEYLSDRRTDIEKTDVKILTINGIGVISGYPDGTFKPTGTLTRAEAVAVISRVINPELRNPVKIVKRDANGVIDANDLDKITIEESGYDKLKEYAQYGMHNDITYKAENLIKADISMLPIRYGGLVITGIQKLPAEKAPYHGDTSIAWGQGDLDNVDAIIIHAYPIEKSDDNKGTTDYWVDSSLNVAFVNKSGSSYVRPVVKAISSYGGEAVYNKIKEMFPNYALGEYPKVEINQQFTTMAFTNKGIIRFELENLSKIIIMDTRGTYYPAASTNDVLEIDASGLKEIK